MEMHQVRYFLAVAQLLNFTRAAEECNVTQPSLTRAIKQLEAELGGDLFRRERPAAQLTELGQRMHPLLKQCYDAAAGARSLASSFRSEAELGIAAEIDEAWERLDVWPLFTEAFDLIVSREHRLAEHDTIEPDDLRAEQLLGRSYCEHSKRIAASLREHGIDVDHGHEISSERDLIELVEADIGVAMMPHTSPVPESLKRAAVAGLDARRTVSLYGVAGRQRTAVANAVMRMLRCADWRAIAG
ncbi:DNA-binding transcriptional LysR family regulator [Bradyrhizobium japonicum]|uniref:LysR family transcriptional regulator n=1 Tax=Bradyrhizobium diazoefficiens TaxID=1355477 RepID=UPI003479F66C